jgi:transcriptional regulator with XRE-family HTH domain
MSTERTVGSELLLSIMNRRTQSEVAEELGVRQSIVSRWISGQEKPGPKARANMQVVLGIPSEAWRAPSRIRPNNRSVIIELAEAVKLLEIIVNKLLVDSAK